MLSTNQCSISLACLLMLASPLVWSAGTPADPVLVAAQLHVSSCSVQTLSFESAGGAGAVVSLQLDPGKEVTLELEAYSVRSDSFLVVTDHVAGPAHLAAIEAPPSRVITGIVQGIPDSIVRGSLHDGQLRALVSTPGGSYGVESLAKLNISGADDEHAVFSLSESLGAAVCGVPGIAGAAAIGGNGATPFGPTVAYYQAQIALDTTVGFVDLLSPAGSSVAERIENAVVYLETAIAMASVPYEALPVTPVALQLGTVVVRTSADPYAMWTDDGPLLDELEVQWTGLAALAPLFPDAVQLFEAHPVNCAMGPCTGSARLAPCGSAEVRVGHNFAGTSAASVSALALSHGLAHNFGALHCDPAAPTDNCSGSVMCETAMGGGSCQSGALFFADSTTVELETFAAACLGAPTPPTLPLPFEDIFETPPSSALNEIKWVYSFGAVPTDVFAASPTHSVCLDGAVLPTLNPPGSPPAIAVEEVVVPVGIWSNFIDASSVVDELYLTFSHRWLGAGSGPELGESLRMEYLALVGTEYHWTQVGERLVATGRVQAAFSEVWYPIPADGEHDRLRIRFLPDGDSSVGDLHDNWYVDNISVTDGLPAGVVTTPILTSITPASSSVDAGLEVEVVGEHFHPLAEVSIDGVLCTDVVYFESTKLTCRIPGYMGTPPADVDVSVQNPTGATATLAGAFHYSLDAIFVQSIVVPFALSSSITVANEAETSGISFGVRVTDMPPGLSILGLSEGADFLALTQPATSFFSPQLYPPDGVTVGMLWDLMPTPMYDALPAGSGWEVATLDFSYSGSLGNPPAEIAVVDDLGSPIVDIVFTDHSGTVNTRPAVGQAVATISFPPAGGAEFARGDCNQDGGAPNLGDAIYLLGYLFPGATPLSLTCASACDMNDDDGLNLSDAIFLLNYLFDPMATPIPPPIGACGIDPTTGALVCGFFMQCP